MATADLPLQKGLPSSVEAERFVLGSILRNSDSYLQVAGTLGADDFSLEKHRRIFGRMGEIFEAGDRIEHLTLVDALMKKGQLESVDGMSYLASLDEGLPEILNLEGYVKIVKNKATLRRLIFASQKTIDRALMGEDDAEEILAGAEEELLRLGESRANDRLIGTTDILKTFPGGINAFLDPSKRLKGLSTGFLKLDEMTGGLHEGELFILAARPSMGKTAFALNIAQHAATRLGKTCAVFSLEMSAESLLTRMVCAQARVDQQKFRAGYLNAHERRQLQFALSELTEAPLFIDDTSGANLIDVHAKLRRLKSERGLDLVVIDYLQLMSGRGRTENRNQEVSALSRGLKLLAKELRVPMIVLSQLSRASETRPGDHKPILSDLRDSGSIEQDADLVAFIYREEVYKQDRDDLKGLAELILAKQRNGPIGKIDLVFLKECTKFENRAGDLGEDPGGAAPPPFDE